MDSPSTPSLIERAQDFAAQNRRSLIFGVATTAFVIGGVLYYTSTSRQRTVQGDLEKSEKKDKKKSRKKKGTATDAKGPILEERKTTVQEADSEYWHSASVSAQE